MIKCIFINNALGFKEEHSVTLCSHWIRQFSWFKVAKQSGDFLLPFVHKRFFGFSSTTTESTDSIIFYDGGSCQSEAFPQQPSRKGRDDQVEVGPWIQRFPCFDGRLHEPAARSDGGVHWRSQHRKSGRSFGQVCKWLLPPNGMVKCIVYLYAPFFF